MSIVKYWRSNHEDPAGFSCCHLLSPGLSQVYLRSSRYTVTVTRYTRSEYSPGTPGAAWSQAELLTVRAKLWRMYSNNQAVFNWWKKDKIPNDLPNPSFKADLGFFAAKVVRLRWV